MQDGLKKTRLRLCHCVTCGNGRLENELVWNYRMSWLKNSLAVVVKFTIRYLDDGDFRYLGRLLNTAASEITSRCQLQEKLDALLSLLDKTLLPATSRLWLYHHFAVPKLSWAFLTLDLTLTFVKKLQAKSLVFLKKWVGLPRCANTAILFVGDRHPGLEKSGRIVAFCDWNARFCDQKT